jgi:hypothetical protein
MLPAGSKDHIDLSPGRVTMRERCLISFYPENSIEEFPVKAENRITMLQHPLHQIKSLEMKAIIPKFLGALSGGKPHLSSYYANVLQKNPQIAEEVKPITKNRGSTSSTMLENMVLISQRSIAQKNSANNLKCSLHNFGVDTVPVVCRSINSKQNRVVVIDGREPYHVSDSCIEESFPRFAEDFP